MVKKVKSLRSDSFYLTGILVISLLIILFFWAPRVYASVITIDGQFDDWEGQPHISDGRGDAVQKGDIAAFYWGTNEGINRLYFMLERFSPAGDSESSIPVDYRLLFDLNNNGSFTDPVDRYALINYNPRPHFGFVQVKIYRTSNSLVSNYGGKWGEGIREGQKKCEFYISMDDLGIDPGQAIRMYVTTGGGGGDRCPDQGDIQWAPVPIGGISLLIVMFLMGIYFLTKELVITKSYKSGK